MDHEQEEPQLNADQLRARIERKTRRSKHQDEKILAWQREITACKESIDGNPKLKELKERSAADEVASLSASPFKIENIISNYISRDHTKKIRLIERCGQEDNFITSYDDGLLRLWEIQHERATIRSLSKRKTPKPMEALVWDSDGRYGIATYKFGDQDHQVGLITIEDGNQEIGFSFLDTKPHLRGAVKCATVVSENMFVTGGEDHRVIPWTRAEDGSWRAATLDGQSHSSRVIGVATLTSSAAISIGYDRKVFVHDLNAGTITSKFKLDHPGMHITRNPEHENLFLITTRDPNMQLHLYDIRAEVKPLHHWGWKQETTETFSAFVMQDWAPNGWVFSSGSGDARINLFDIRYNGREPFHTLKAHTRQVSKAIFHPNQPELVSISNDLWIGFHNLRCNSVYCYFRLDN